MPWSHLRNGSPARAKESPHGRGHQCVAPPVPVVPGLRRTVVHERSYEEVRELVLLLAEQPISRDVVAELHGIVALADHG